ncbi:MAG: transcriptional regulator [Hyphomicrobium sp.]|nr:transcriptional regulator [Hyphomicrobium sp.]
MRDRHHRTIYLRRPEDIAGLIRSRREALGLSQQALAERLSVSRKWVNEVEQGNQTAKLGLVLRALNELGINLIGETPKATSAALSPTTLAHNVDIDAIADMSLSKNRNP